MRTWNDFENACETRIPGYGRRTEQGRLAHTVERLLVQNGNGALQAGTGTGKSFAYLVPALLRALNEGGSTVVATATKNLQNQIADKDLPLLVALLAEITGVTISFANIKGRSNYICRAQLADAHSGEVEVDPAVLAQVTEIVGTPDDAEAPEHDGDLAHFPPGVIDDRSARALTISTEECPGRQNCPFGEGCFAYKAKDRAADASIVVTNHAMLAMDLKTAVETHDEQTGEFTGYKHLLLPEYDTAVIDEAHNFEGYLTNMIGSQLTERTFAALAAEANAVCEETELGKQMVASARVVFGELGSKVDVRGKERTRRLTPSDFEEVIDDWARLRTDLGRIGEALEATPRAKTNREAARKARLRRRIESLYEKLVVLDPRSEDSPAGEVVRWVQVEERTFRGQSELRTTVGFSPLSVAQFCRDRLWPYTNGLLLSATLRPADDATFIPRQLGLDDGDYETFDAGTPFDYPRQAGVCVADGLNPKNGPSWSNQGHRVTMKAIEASGGRALLLFTSRREMLNRYEALREDIEDLGYAVHVQREGVPTDELIRAKKEDPTSVVFGLKGMMEGVDVQGDALRLVVLDKLPFPVPSEVVTAARTEAWDKALAERKGIRVQDIKAWDRDAAFSRLSVPAMALLLEQAFGRLIRTVTDRGVVLILDERISPRENANGKNIGTGYGRRVFATLPPARDLPTIAKMVAYLEKINA